tara:strand:+ start:53 stop:223 length:171 start_codon:yes stop_codon:yes gene_type:complete
MANPNENDGLTSMGHYLDQLVTDSDGRKYWALVKVDEPIKRPAGEPIWNPDEKRGE